MSSTDPTEDADSKSEGAEQGSKKPIEFPDDDFDMGFDDDEEHENGRTLALNTVLQEARSAFLIHLLDSGFPAKEKGLLYFLIVQLHENLYAPLYVYSALPAILMWYQPWIAPRHVYTVTRMFDNWDRGSSSSNKELGLIVMSNAVSTFLLRFTINFEGVIELVEPLFGPIDAWPAALLPIVPGIFFRSTQERPNSINGFIPENKQGIAMAMFIYSCTALLPRPVQWWLWAAYATPSIEHPTMVVDFIICTFSWVFLDVTPMAGYAMWLLVNQYRHPKTWFRISGGGPSVVLLRERRGTLWYIATILSLGLLELGPGKTLMKQDFLVLHPQTWIPLTLVVIIGIYLLRYGMVLRIYRFKHKPLPTAQSFRLLRLRAQPCFENAPIQCDMIETAFHNPPQYVAVSHRWDSVESSKEFILIDGGLFRVSQSIYAFLKAKRSKVHPRYFWIDSVCIDQNDAAEKSKQVGLMRNIFEEADMMLGWLGDDSGAEKALSLIRKINQATTDAALARLRSDLDIGWNELGKLMSNEWFERAWYVRLTCGV